ncbi:AMIN-like domain-containing (lipo)protein [Streptomyces sp. 3N207]|uniref:AMIN-like domain-containing (lipo)protein n=1 Tax=Streptomyces sp. 3N207 TaxID=3457417 RepID=UPI003FD49786
MPKIGTAATALVLAGAGLAATASTAGAATAPADKTTSATSCPRSWTSTAKSSPATTTKQLKTITVGKNACFDRMVFNIKGLTGKAGYRAEYVKKFKQDGSGEEIKVKGGAILNIHVNAPSYDTSTGKSWNPAKGVNVTGYKTFRDVKFGTSVEGQTQVGLGVRAKLPFRVSQSGTKLIVDVAHTR